MDITKFYNWLFPRPMTINFWAFVILIIGLFFFMFIIVKITEFIIKFLEHHKKQKK